MEICTNHSNKTCWVNLADTGKCTPSTFNLIKINPCTRCCLCLKHEKNYYNLLPFWEFTKIIDLSVPGL